MKLINEVGDLTDFMNELIKEYPSTVQFFDMIGEILGCNKDELRVINVHPDYEKTDEEGWEIKSFFPKTDANNFNVENLHSGYHTSDFYFGDIYKITYHGITLVAIHNCMTIGMFINLKDC